MLVYRIAKKDVIKDLSGTGAKLYGGRWNHKGTAVVYTSETRALATVEFLVHVSLSNAPRGLMIATIEIPCNIASEDVPRGSLPRGWRDYPRRNEKVCLDFFVFPHNIAQFVPDIVFAIG